MKFLFVLMWAWNVFKPKRNYKKGKKEEEHCGRYFLIKPRMWWLNFEFNLSYCLLNLLLEHLYFYYISHVIFLMCKRITYEEMLISFPLIGANIQQWRICKSSKLILCLKSQTNFNAKFDFYNDVKSHKHWCN